MDANNYPSSSIVGRLLCNESPHSDVCRAKSNGSAGTRLGKDMAMRLDRNHVLVIDDDANTRLLLKLLLEQYNYDVLLAPDGEVGLAMAETQQPDIILLDVAMPRRDGMDVYLDLYHNPRMANIPVLVLSASLSNRDIQAWRGLPNVVDALAKPYNIYALVERIDEVCRGQFATAV
jgi:chemosensory pili system protein ChpA (sensor histidine kinase/response regulator)